MPYGFPKPGLYRIFLQFKRAEQNRNRPLRHRRKLSRMENTHQHPREVVGAIA